MGGNLEIRVRTVGGNRLIDDYARGEAALAPFFAGHPFDPDAYRRKAEEVRARFDPAALEAMAEAVHPLGDEAAGKLRRIAGGEGFFVTTGQQPGLFGGPLYTVHKTLSAVALARKLERLLDVPVLPVFWIASDDHDWEEANHASLLDTGNTLRTLTLPGQGEPRRSMGRTPLNGAADDALGELEESLPPSEFTPSLLEQTRAAYSEGETVAGAFRRLLESLFDGLVIGLVDAQDPTVRRLGAPVLRRELEGAASHEAVLRSQTSRLESAGYGVQVPILEGATNVFYEDEHGRERVLREEGRWVLRASKRVLTEAELLALLDGEGERFSANVVLRPVVESAVFPTLAYVGGPGEVRYLAQTGCLFEAHGVGMPIVYPRLGVTLVERKVRKVLEKFGLEEGDFVGRPLHEVIAGVVREDVPEAVQAALGEIRQALQERYQALYEAAESIDPTLKGPIFGARNDGFRAASEVEKKIRQHVKLKEETELEQVEKAAVNLAPGGKPQERVLNVHQYLARYGPGLIPEILERLDVPLDGSANGWDGVDCG